MSQHAYANLAAIMKDFDDSQLYHIFRVFLVSFNVIELKWSQYRNVLVESEIS
jgi:hypothetical protein